MALAQLHDRLEQRFSLLTGGSRAALPRQQTLRALVEWSYELLSDPEQTAFCRLSVFSGGFDLDAAEAVVPDEDLGTGAVLDLLDSLVDKSLIVYDPGVDRYRLLETLRQYGAEHLSASGDASRVQDRHLRYFLDLARRGYQARTGAESEWLAQLESEHDNLRVALGWARHTRPNDELALAGFLGWFWQLHSHYVEGQARLSEVLDGREDVSPEVARALWGLGILAGMTGDRGSALSPAELSVTMWRELGDDAEVAAALESLGWGAFMSGRDEESLARFEESLVIRQRLDNERLVNVAELEVCQALVALGRVDEAEARSRAALPAAIANSDPKAIHWAHHFIGDCALIRGEVDEAERRYQISLRSAIELGDEFETACELDGIAMAVAGQGRWRKALILRAAAADKLGALGADLSQVHFWNGLLERYLGPARKGLGQESAPADAEGRSLGFAGAIEYAGDTSLD